MSFIPLVKWNDKHPYPSQYAWNNLLRPEKKRDELINAGVVVKYNGRWLVNESAWHAYVVKQGKVVAAQAR